jgi:folate-binding protein YgfZ
VGGEDAATFLQGQFTNDLRALDRQAAVYGLWLTVKGKILADSFVLREKAPNTFYLGSYFSPASTIKERLESYVIADDVVVEDVTAEWAGISYFGNASTEDVRARAGPSAFVFPGRRMRESVTECVHPVAAGEPGRLLQLGGVELTASEVHQRRVLAGIPAVPMDAGPTDLPQEAGLEADAISYTKGCYLGQEVMARLKSMGQVRRRLLAVHGEDERWPALPAAVFRNERQVGELRSAAGDPSGGWHGLAMLSLMHLEPDAALSFAPEAAPALRVLPFP